MKKKVGKVKVIYVLIVCTVIVAGVLGTIFYMTHTEKEEKKEETKVDTSKDTPKQYDGQYHKEKYDGEEFYIIDNDYTGEHDIQLTNLFDEDADIGSGQSMLNEFEVSEILSYEEYSEFCEKFDLEQKYEDEDMSYVTYSYASYGSPNLHVRLADVEFKKKTVKLYIWDEASGVTADCMAYVIFIPTKEKVKEIEIEPLFTMEEFNEIAGKSPVEGMTFTVEDNKIMAQNAYVKTDSKEIDEIINKMLDEIVKQHTIDIHSEAEDEEIDTQYDLISSAKKYKTADGYNGYALYGTEYGVEYMSNGRGLSNMYERSSTTSRENILFDLAMYFNLNIIIDYADKDKNPYYYDESELKQKLELKSDDKNYIIVYDRKGSFNTIHEEYYINKDTYLLEKVEAKTVYTDDELEGTSTFKYTDEVVTVPERVIKNSQEYVSVDKPIIYLYPEKEREISVKLGFKDKITVSYPKYEDGWNVLAKPNGDLKDLDTDRNLYSLYYESDAVVDFKVREDGFVVKGEDSAKFLEEKLEILGLSEREAEEFIVYWLPKLEANKYNYIRFATDDEIDQNMPLDISPKPDTTIRVLMTYKGLDKKINVKEQKLERKARNGYTVVEWGGTEIK